MSYKIDGTDPNNLNNKVLSEKETRLKLYSHAAQLGCGQEMKDLFKKYDQLLRNCTNDQERKDIGKMGIFEMYSLLGRGGELYVDGKLVYKE